MRFEVLGPLRVLRDGAEVVIPGRLRQRLLALLLSRPNTTVPVGQVLVALWGADTDPGAAKKLQVLVHNLRKSLGEPDRVRFESGGYRLLVRDGELDTERFDALVTEAGRIADPLRRAGTLRAALELWRGNPFQELELPELAGDVQRLTEGRLAAVEELFAAELAGGRHAAVVAELTETAARHPLRERLHALLMTALHRAGRQADALAVYQRARRTLVDELGLEPGPQLREAERQVLAGEAGEPRPAQLPHTAPAFVGRAAEQAELDRLAREVPVVVVTGTAGVGKTALVTHWARHARDWFPDGQLYLDLRGYGPDEPVPAGEALARFLRALGVPGAELPDDVAERAARFRSLLDRERVLVVLDNAATADQVRPLLPGTTSCFVVITSRDALSGLAAREGAHRLTLDRMTVEEARGLLTARLGHLPDATADATARLIERCARLPLALCVAAERIGERPGSIVDLDEELADEQHRLDLLDAGDAHTSVRAVFSWSYRQLDPAAARLFRLFGLRPGPDIDLYGLTALAGEDTVAPVRRLLDPLLRAHLVEPVDAGRYAQHDLLWAYSAELAAAHEPERQAALTRLLDHYRYTAAVAVHVVYPDTWPHFPRPATPVPDLTATKDAEAWLDAEYANLVAAAGHGLPEYTGDLSATLARHIRRRARHSQAHTLYSQALATAREVGDRAGEQVALAGLGHVLRMAGQYDQAAGHYRAALAITRDLGDRHGELRALGGLGDTYFTTGHHRLATEQYERLLTTARAEGHRLGELKGLASLGHGCVVSGRYADSERYYRQAYAIARELGNRGSELTAILGLGHLHMLTGRYEQATEYHRQGLAIAREVGHHLAELSALAELGELAWRTGDHETAQPLYEQALAMTIGAGIHSNEVHVLTGLGRVHLALGRHGRAAEHFHRAHAIAEASGHLIGVVIALEGLGRTSLATGDAAEALRHLRTALAIAEELEHPREQVLCLLAVAQALGDGEEAAAHWRKALEIGTALGLPEVSEPHRVR